jgi:hypothetical protein
MAFGSLYKVYLVLIFPQRNIMQLRHDLHFRRFFPFFIILLYSFSINSSCKPDSVYTASPPVNYFYEPYPLEKGTYVLNLGGSFSLLPLPLVENEYPVPAVDFQLKWGVFTNHSIIASFSTNIFGNLLHSGIQWNTHAGKFSFSLGNHLGGFFGFMTADKVFNKNKAYAFFSMPIIRMGYRFDDFSISMTWASSFIFNSKSDIDGKTAQGPQKEFNDIFCTIAVEQPFLRSSYLSIGFSLTYARSPYQAWMMYNTIDQYLFIPEFFFAFQI